MESQLIQYDNRIYRATQADGKYIATTANGKLVVDAAKARRFSSAAFFACAFDEWPTLTREQKANIIRLAVSHNPQMGWAPGATQKIINNMPIFDHCVLKTSLLVRSGRKNYGCRRILEAARYDTDLQMIDVSFKINNNLVPDVARAITAIFPEIPHKFFELRRNHQRGAAA